MYSYFPGTLSDAKQKRYPLGTDGVEGVRVGLNSANPPVTRVVVDMDSALPYALSTEGNHIVLRVQPSDTVAASKHRGPVPAASAPIISVFHRNQAQPSTGNDTTAQAPIPVPPKLPPINFPPEKQPARHQRTASATNANPSAARPKLGSLQQGTVFPGMGARVAERFRLRKVRQPRLRHPSTHTAAYSDRRDSASNREASDGDGRAGRDCDARRAEDLGLRYDCRIPGNHGRDRDLAAHCSSGETERSGSDRECFSPRKWRAGVRKRNTRRG